MSCKSSCKSFSMPSEVIFVDTTIDLRISSLCTLRYNHDNFKSVSAGIISADIELENGTFNVINNFTNQSTPSWRIRDDAIYAGLFNPKAKNPDRTLFVTNLFSSITWLQ